VPDRTDAEGAIWYELSAAGVRRIDWRRGAPRPWPGGVPVRPRGPQP